MKSVLQNNKECWFCYQTYGLEEHHIFFGTANRKKSEKRGLKVWLCAEHHRGDTGAHKCIATNIALKHVAQRYYELHYGTRNDFIKEFGKSYL